MHYNYSKAGQFGIVHGFNSIYIPDKFKVTPIDVILRILFPVRVKFGCLIPQSFTVHVNRDCDEKYEPFD